MRTHAGLDADEAVVGLMAKHILEGREMPVFYYGQHYFGALEAYLTVPAFSLLGDSSWALRIVPLAFSLLSVGATALLSRQLWGRQAAWTAAAIAAVPPLFSFDFQLRARGGFPESLALTLLLAWMAARLLEPEWADQRRVFTFGLMTGLLLYVFQAAFLPAAAFLALSAALRPRPSARSYLIWTGGALLGAAPLLLYNLAHPLATVMEAGGQKFLGMRLEEYRQSGLWTSLLSALTRRLADLRQAGDHLWTVLAGRPWYESGWEELAAGAFLIAVVLGAVWQLRRLLPALLGRRLDRKHIPPTAVPVLLFVLTLLAGFLHPRYLLACFPAAAMLAAALGDQWAKRNRLLPGLLLLLPLLFGLQQVQFLRAIDPSGHSSLLACLREAGVSRGYADYWLAYPVVFLSDERIILSPAADPEGVDRYPPYSRLVAASDPVGLVWIKDGPAERRSSNRLGPAASRLPRFSCCAAVVYPSVDQSLCRLLLPE